MRLRSRARFAPSCVAAAVVLGVCSTPIHATTAVAAPAARAASAAPVAQAAATGGDPSVVAHRGSSGTTPENTLASAREAVADGADEIENDIQRTRDGVLVLVHDTSLARTTDVEEVYPDRAPWAVGQFTYRELRRLDAGSWFGPEFAGERIPTLEQWGRTVQDDAAMLLEVKSPASYPGIERDLSRVLDNVAPFRKALRQGRLVVQSFDVEWLRVYEELAPAVPKGLLYSTRPTAQQISDAAEWAEWVNPSFRVIEESDVDAVQAAGLKIAVYTVNTGQDMRRLVRWGVDGIITDYPQVLRGVLARR